MSKKAYFKSRFIISIILCFSIIFASASYCFAADIGLVVSITSLAYNTVSSIFSAITSGNYQQLVSSSLVGILNYFRELNNNLFIGTDTYRYDFYGHDVDQIYDPYLVDLFSDVTNNTAWSAKYLYDIYGQLYTYLSGISQYLYVNGTILDRISGNTANMDNSGVIAILNSINSKLPFSSGSGGSSSGSVDPFSKYHFDIYDIGRFRALRLMSVCGFTSNDGIYYNYHPVSHTEWGGGYFIFLAYNDNSQIRSILPNGISYFTQPVDTYYLQGVKFSSSSNNLTFSGYGDLVPLFFFSETELPDEYRRLFGLDDDLSNLRDINYDLDIISSKLSDLSDISVNVEVDPVVLPGIDLDLDFDLDDENSLLDTIDKLKSLITTGVTTSVLLNTLDFEELSSGWFSQDNYDVINGDLEDIPVVDYYQIELDNFTDSI